MPKRILIVEDESSVRHAVRAYLESRASLEIHEAADGTEAIRKAQAVKPDLVVLDLSMPQANGVEVAALLHTRMPHTPVVVFTMFEDILGKPLSKALGIAAVVSKSDGVIKLWGRIEALLAAEDALQQRHV
jgi:DNA-binding NarL/FixJ family response regulator